MTTKERRILIVDPQTINRHRRNRLVDIFERCIIYRLVLLPDKRRKPSIEIKDKSGKWKKVDTPHDITLILIHARDNKYAKSKLLKAILSSGTPVIWYGGKQGEDSDVPPGEDKIWQAISPTSLISKQDAHDLIQYAISKTKGINPTKPKCLMPPEYYLFLRSFAILCQGYLVANAYFESPSEKTVSMKDALTSLKFGLPKLTLPNFEAVENTRTRTWWKQPFKLKEGEIKEKIKHEWTDGDMFPSVSMCLDEIYGEKKSGPLLPSIDIRGENLFDIIVKSYKEIAVYLRRKP